MNFAPSVQQPGDATLLDMVWAGDTEAFGVVYERHVMAARRLAHLLAGSPAEAEDAVAQAFAEVLDGARRNSRVSSAVRPDVLTVLRQMCDEQFSGSELSVLENTLIAHAYFSLPDSWRTVLWHAEVEQAADADIAPLLGVAGSGVVSLRRRAEEGLRQAYLDCGGEHEDEELAELGATMRAVVGPIVLGSATARYLDGAAGQPAPVAAGTAADGRPGEITDWDNIYDPDATNAASLPAVKPAAGRRPRERSSRTVAAGAGLVAGVIVLVLAVAFIRPHSAPGKVSSLRPVRSQAAAAPTPLPSAPSPTPSPSRSRLLGLLPSRSPSPSAPSASSPPAPAPTSAPAPASAQLTASIDPGQNDDPFEPSLLTFDVSDVGSAATGQLTASVTIPGDVEVVPDGPATGGWDCEPSGSNGAVCTHSPLSPGQDATGTVEYTQTCGEFSVVVTSGSVSATAGQNQGC
jgi:DNA-directed RNA polymerase specialized sigma24 family protein